MSKLGDLIVRLRLKHDDYEKGLKDSEKKTQDFGGAVKQSWMAVTAKVAAVAAAIGAVVKITAEVVKHSQRMGDAWNREVAGMKAAWSTFLNGLSEGDLANIGERMRENAKAAQDYYDALDAIGEAQTAAALVEAETLKRYQTLMEDARNVNKSAKERISAITEMKEILTRQNSGLVQTYSQVAEEAVDAFLLKINTALKKKDITAEMRQQVKDFLIWMGNQEEGFDFVDKTAKDILQLNDRIEELNRTIFEYSSRGLNYGPQAREVKQLQAAIEQLRKSFIAAGGNIEYLDMLLGYYTGDTEEARKELEKWNLEAAKQDNNVAQTTQRFTTLQNSLLKTVKTTKELVELLPALGEGFAELFNKETSADFVGPMSPQVKQVYDIMKKLESGGSDGGGGSKKSRSEVYADSLKEMKAKYEQHLKWIKSSDMTVKEADRQMYEELSKNGATYYHFLIAERDKYLKKTSSNKEDKAIINLLNDEIAGLTKLEDIPVDTTSLQKFDDVIVDLIDDMKELNDFEIEIPSPDPNFDTFDEYAEHLEHMAQKTEQLNQIMQQAIVDGISNSIQYLVNSLMGLEEISGEAIMQAVLEPLAQAAITMGSLIMAEGIAALAFQQSLGNPYAAIAAGAALIAIGAVAKAGLQAAVNKATGNNSGPTYVGSSASSNENMQTELTIYIKGRISGSDIVLSGQKTLNEWSK